MRDVMFLFLVACLTASSTASCPYDNPDLDLWDRNGTWDEGVPTKGIQVTIRSGMKVLLNTSPPPLASITIEEGGVLVWGNFSDLKLTVSYILVKGTFEIGSDTCRFKHNAFIVLTGKSNSQVPPPVSGFGRKFIGVGPNGTLEFHGAHKLSWTKLIQTVPAAAKTCGMLYNHRERVFSKELVEGLHVTAFENDGSLYDFQVFGTNMADSDPAVAFESFITGIPSGLVVAIALNKGFGTTNFPDRDWKKIYTTIETLGKMTPESSQIRNIGEKDAYAFITQKGQKSTTKEDRATQKASEGRAETKRLSITLANPDLTFNVKSVVENTKSMRNDVDFRVLTNEVANPIIKLKDDVATWKVYAGEQLVVTSTDYEWQQAEVFTIIPCQGCAANEVQLDHEFEHMHFGEITYGIDQRAEVAMLSRNIKIKGQLEDKCYANDEQEEELCNLFKRDTFGGHFKVVRYFKRVHVQQVEFEHMGQQRFLGSYPIHFHMVDDGDGAWVRDCTVHDSLARCSTLHGSDGIELSRIVCYKHFGHGFFLEDSAETRNILDGNIGIGTMPGTHIPSDRDKNWCHSSKGSCGAASTFWLTHPHNYIRNNVAAGSDVNGFWFITANEPLGPSKERQEIRGIVKPGHAKHSPILQFENNVAHSCGERGLRIDARISNNETKDGKNIPENGVIGGTTSHDPRDPPEKKGVSVISYMDNFTSYKNRHQCVWTKAGKLVMRKFSIADCPRGLAMARGAEHTYTVIRDCIFIGETDNPGEPIAPYERSLPHKNGKEPVVGSMFYQGPGFVRNCHFDQYFHRYWNGEFRPAGAISSKQNNPYPSTAHSHVKNITFGFCDKTEGNWVFIGNGSIPFFSDRDGMKQITFRDVDGTVTGTPNTQVVKNNRFFTTPRCSVRDNWLMVVCPYEYCKVVFSGSGGVLQPNLIKQTPVHLRRDDSPEDRFEVKGEKGLHYLVINGKSYTLYFNGNPPREITIRGENFQRGYSVRLGICLPKDTKSFNFPKKSMTEVFSVADVDKDETGGSYFWDHTRGLLVVKITTDKVRIDGEKCPGYVCPTLRIVRVGGGDGPINCYDDAYGPYRKAEDAPTGIPNEKSCMTSPPNDRGAQVDVGSFSSTDFNVTCPVPPTDQGRNTSEYKGCYTDNSMYRDVDQNHQTLPRSMTVEGCVERCYQYGYAYAALQNGRDCRCGDAYGVYGKDVDGCKKACTGDPDQVCGGMNRNSIHSTGKAPPPTLAACGKDNEGAVINGKCFYLGEDANGFIEGQRACVKLGGNLATIATVEVQEQVVQYLRTKRTSAWFGLNDVVKERSYKFMDGTSLGSYSNFKSGEEVGKEDFGLLFHGALFHWSDRRHSEKHRYLCQLPTTGSVATPQACGTNNLGKRFGNGKCYAVINDKIRHVDAQYACYTRMGVLAPLSDSITKKDIINHVYHFGVEKRDYWTGEVGAEAKTFIELRYRRLYNEFAVKSGDRNGAVCLLETVDAAKPCPTPWKENEEFCYLYTERGSTTLAQATSMCKQGASYIVTIHSEAENNFVGNLVRNFNPSQTPAVLLGYTYNATGEKFQWVDGIVSSYTNWKSGHGTGNVETEKCTKMGTFNTDFQWLNKDCNKGGAKVVCKAPARL